MTLNFLLLLDWHYGQKCTKDSDEGNLIEREGFAIFHFSLSSRNHHLYNKIFFDPGVLYFHVVTIPVSKQLNMGT